ncbi:hypothetical protein GQ54DRAFT_310183 [Martensiomyces pterosporus]|nr:hypothetical protein GQ54DRAFT_310183 [Martensiomyces pterosporus]
MQSLVAILAASAALASANSAPADGNHQKYYTTANAPQYGQYAPYGQPAIVQPAVVQPATIVQNAGADVTVTETVVNGAASNAISLGSALVAGALLFTYF